VRFHDDARDATFLPLLSAAISLADSGILLYPLMIAASLASAETRRQISTNRARFFSTGSLLNSRMQRRSAPRNKRTPEAGCDAIGGFNRMHAILGTSEHCISTHPSDMCVALAALDATICVNGPEGERRISFNEFHLLPQSTPQAETVLRRNELITSVELPPMPFVTRARYRKVRDRSSYAFALVSVAAALEIDNGKISNVRLALGGVAPKPWRAYSAESVLAGSAPRLEVFQHAAEAELREARAFPYNSFKIELAKRTIVSVLSELAEEATRK
jgi:xanthine dehydrogenase YagS FAD-binding subunit